MQWELEQEEVEDCVGSTADSEYSIKPREMNSFFSSLGKSNKKQEVIDSK